MGRLSIDTPGGRHGGYVYENGQGILSFGDIEFDKSTSEAQDYLHLYNLIAHFNPELVILEHGFLFVILGYLGGIKMACSILDIPWWQVGASRAKKLVLGHGRSDKKTVKQWAERETGRVLSQHCADAYLYLQAHKQRT